MNLREVVMGETELRSIAVQFRQAIVDARDNGEFNRKDRMSDFPDGCCDDVADLFANYLFHTHGIVSERIDGSYHDENPENNAGHSWQEVNGLIVDLTGSQRQFKLDPLFLNYNEETYVGHKDKFHKMFEEDRREPCRGIEDLGSGCWDRMNRLYGVILRYLKSN